jgi:hypothetical protein
MLSELLANVMVHTDTWAEVCADITGTPGRRTLRVAVGDGDDNLPHRRYPGEMASSGRGVLLLQTLSSDSGVHPRGTGKAIWFKLHEDEEQEF